jgi:hypothetical protein
MTATKAKRSTIRHYLNTGTIAAPVWNRLGYAVSTGEIAYNPQTEETADITMDTKVTDITGYSRSLAIEGVVYPGDPVFDFIDNLRINMAVLDGLKTELVHVWAYKTPTGTPATWPAEKVPVNIGIESIGGEGATTAKIKYTIYDAGDPVIGTFEPVAGTFTAD